MHHHCLLEGVHITLLRLCKYRVRISEKPCPVCCPPGGSRQPRSSLGLSLLQAPVFLSFPSIIIMIPSRQTYLHDTHLILSRLMNSSSAAVSLETNHPKTRNPGRGYT
ncbi:hypothetical protein BDZ89DRAFT_181915 [Hymenopellis radicata]|nr:hypothetical protein BDZ89DRAFT_181915 [Hymenopellis radicata]